MDDAADPARRSGEPRVAGDGKDQTSPRSVPAGAGTSLGLVGSVWIPGRASGRRVDAAVGSGLVGLLLRDQAADPLGEQGAVERLLEGVVEARARRVSSPGSSLVRATRIVLRWSWLLRRFWAI